MPHPTRRARTATVPPPSTPTPIRISRRTRTVLLAAGAASILLLLWRAPSVVTLAIGGVAFAVVLSYPVGLMSRAVPRGVAILLSFLLVAAILLAVIIGVVPVLVSQLGALVDATPGIIQRIGDRLPSLFDRLTESGLLPADRAAFIDDIQRELLDAIQGFARRLLGQLGRVLTGALSVMITLFGVVFIGAYMLSDARTIRAGVLRATPHAYRRDVRDLWTAFAVTLSRYLGGLTLSLAIQGVLSAIALYLLGVPYAALLGAWVAVTALIPYIGAWIGAVPAVLLALSVSPMTALFTAVLFLVIQQLEGNVLTPRIQGQAVRVHPVIIFLAVIAAGELAGIAGVIFAVPVLAVLRVLVDFFRVRVRTVESARVADAGTIIRVS
ncbi:MAG TPA: AI-2E family transporter [Gemmatimonadaceae bacterium]